MKQAVKVGDVYYPYTKTIVGGYEYFQVRIKIGTYSDGCVKYKRISSDSLKELKEKVTLYLKFNITEQSDVTIAQIAYAWLKSKYELISPGTYDKIESVVKAHVVPEIGNNSVSSLNEEFLQDYIAQLAVSGNTTSKETKGLGYNTLNKIKSVLSEISEYAVRKGYIERNYVKYVTIPKRVEKPPEKRVMDDEGLQRFMNELNKKNINGEYIHYYRNAIMFMLYTGLRACEIFALEKDMVDFDKRFIKIERNRVRSRKRSSTGEPIGGYVTKIYNETKNKSSKRIVPLVDEAYDILVQACNNSKSQICFPNKEGRVVKPTTFADKFNKLCKKANVDVTPHSLRHTFACSVYYNSTLDITKLSKLLGHSTPQVTYNTYLHQIESKEAKFIEEIKDLYGVNGSKNTA